MRRPVLFQAMGAALVVAAAGMGASVSGSLISGEVESGVTAPVGPGATGARVIRAQILLACTRFSSGEIDGRYGDDLSTAIRGYQESHALKPTGVIDAEMWKLLDAHTAPPLLVPYTVTLLSG
jgi:peptidoglycan hydrolase-like protein with peptidoglycan-binding domain